MATTELARQQLLIGGEWTDAGGGGQYEQSFPFTGEPVGSPPRPAARTRAPRSTPPTSRSAGGHGARPGSAGRSS